MDFMVVTLQRPLAEYCKQDTREGKKRSSKWAEDVSNALWCLIRMLLARCRKMHSKGRQGRMPDTIEDASYICPPLSDLANALSQFPNCNQQDVSKLFKVILGDDSNNDRVSTRELTKFVTFSMTGEREENKTTVREIEPKGQGRWARDDQENLQPSYALFD